MNTTNLKTKSVSLIITAIAALLVILLLFITFSFEIKKEPLPIIIELALNESNYGNKIEGNTPTEPLPTKSANPVTENTKVTKTTPKAKPKVKTRSITQDKTPAPAASTNKAEKAEKPKPQGDARAKSALENILGGKGNQKSTGQGNGKGRGNIGDPKGNTDHGETIGENWKTRIPENQSHNCSTGGIVVVDIVVNTQGKIKRAVPQLSSNDCLAKTAKDLVLKYVSAYPGKDNRRGSYRVTLK